jgi:hypothetical protein
MGTSSRVAASSRRGRRTPSDRYARTASHASISSRASVSRVGTPKREFWNNADPERLPDAWRLTKVKPGATRAARAHDVPNAWMGESCLRRSTPRIGGNYGRTCDR